MKYTTKMLIEVEVETQHGPYAALNMIQNILGDVTISAIKSVNLFEIESDYKPRSEQDANYTVLNQTPKSLK